MVIIDTLVKFIVALETLVMIVAALLGPITPSISSEIRLYSISLLIVVVVIVVVLVASVIISLEILTLISDVMIAAIDRLAALGKLNLNLPIVKRSCAIHLLDSLRSLI